MTTSDAFYIVYSEGDPVECTTTSIPEYRGVQVIVQRHPEVGWHTQAKYDFYIRRDHRWVGVDRAGLFDHLEAVGLAKFNIGYTHKVMLRGTWVTVDEFGLYKWLESQGLALFGRTLTTSQFNDAMRRAIKIKAVEEEKTAWASGER